uniref:Uncharacterized protein n=1 Tax=viral metagenome TaxID=1070528 RepID=A0A6C0BQG9_9ZZZZ
MEPFEKLVQVSRDLYALGAVMYFTEHCHQTSAYHNDWVPRTYEPWSVSALFKQTVDYAGAAAAVGGGSALALAYSRLQTCERRRAALEQICETKSLQMMQIEELMARLDDVKEEIDRRVAGAAQPQKQPQQQQQEQQKEIRRAPRLPPRIRGDLEILQQQRAAELRQLEKKREKVKEEVKEGVLEAAQAAELQALRTRSQTLERELAKSAQIQTDLEQAQARVQDLESQIQLGGVEKVKDVQLELAEARLALSKVQDQAKEDVKQARAEARAEAVAEMEALKTKNLEEVAALQKEIEQRKLEEQGLREQIEAQELQKAAELKSKKELELKIDEAKGEVEELLAGKQQYVTKLAELTAARQREVDEFRLQAAELQAQKQAGEQELQRKREELKTLQNLKSADESELAALRVTQAAKEKEVEALQAQKQAGEQELQRKREELKTLQNLKSADESELAALRVAQAAKEKEVEALQQKQVAKEQEFERLQQEQQKEAAELKLKLQEVTEKQRRLQEDLQVAKEAKEQSVGNLAKTLEAIEEKEQQMRAKEQQDVREIERLLAEKQELVALREAQDEELKVKADRVATLEDVKAQQAERLMTLVAEKKQNAVKIAELQQINNQDATKLAELSAQIEQRDRSLADISEKENNLQKEAKQLRLQLQEAQQILTQTKAKDQDTLKRKVQEYKKQLEAVNRAALEKQTEKEEAITALQELVRSKDAELKLRARARERMRQRFIRGRDMRDAKIEALRSKEVEYIKKQEGVEQRLRELQEQVQRDQAELEERKKSVADLEALITRERVMKEAEVKSQVKAQYNIEFQKLQQQYKEAVQNASQAKVKELEKKLQQTQNEVQAEVKSQVEAKYNIELQKLQQQYKEAVQNASQAKVQELEKQLQQKQKEVQAVQSQIEMRVQNRIRELEAQHADEVQEAALTAAVEEKLYGVSRQATNIRDDIVKLVQTSEQKLDLAALEQLQREIEIKIRELRNLKITVPTEEAVEELKYQHSQAQTAEQKQQLWRQYREAEMMRARSRPINEFNANVDSVTGNDLDPLNRNIKQKISERKGETKNWQQLLDDTKRARDEWKRKYNAEVKKLGELKVRIGRSRDKLQRDLKRCEGNYKKCKEDLKTMQGEAAVYYAEVNKSANYQLHTIRRELIDALDKNRGIRNPWGAVSKSDLENIFRMKLRWEDMPAGHEIEEGLDDRNIVIPEPPGESKATYQRLVQRATLPPYARTQKKSLADLLADYLQRFMTLDSQNARLITRGTSDGDRLYWAEYPAELFLSITKRYPMISIYDWFIWDPFIYHVPGSGLIRRIRDDIIGKERKERKTRQKTYNFQARPPTSEEIKAVILRKVRAYISGVYVQVSKYADPPSMSRTVPWYLEDIRLNTRSSRAISDAYKREAEKKGLVGKANLNLFFQKYAVRDPDDNMWSGPYF